MAETQEWTEAPDALRSTHDPRYRRWGDLIEAIKSGKTVFVKLDEGERAASAARMALRDTPDLMVRTRIITHNGERGVVMWLADRPK
jgi:hypothetical protein